MFDSKRPDMAAQLSAKTLEEVEENPAPAGFYLGQVVPQSSTHEHNTDLSVTNLQPQRESHRTKNVPWIFRTELCSVVRGAKNLRFGLQREKREKNIKFILGEKTTHIQR